VETLRGEIDLQVKDAQASLETLQESVATCTAEVESTQKALGNAKSTGDKAHSMETLVCPPPSIPFCILIANEFEKKIR